MKELMLPYDEYDDLVFYESMKSGSYGKIIEYSNDTLLKLYTEKYYEIRNSSIDELMRNNEKELVQIKKKKDILDKTVMSDLLKGIVLTENCFVGVMLTYYKDYKTLAELQNELTKDDKAFILYKLKNIMNNLMENGCYATDLRDENIMIRKSDLDVKIIDLDDVLTQYEFNLDNSLKKKLKIKCYESLDRMNRSLI